MLDRALGADWYIEEFFDFEITGQGLYKMLAKYLAPHRCSSCIQQHIAG
jgi:hypothetical protein